MATCVECDEEYELDAGADEDGFCHGCAHALLDEARDVLGTILSLGVLNAMNHGITKPKAEALFVRLNADDRY